MAVFDPNKPFEDISSIFDPNKPFEEMGAESIDATIFDEDPELQRLQQQLDRPTAPISMGGFGGDTASIERKIQDRRDDLFGLAKGGAPISVRQFESSGVDAEQTIRNLLNQEFEQPVEVKREPLLDNSLIWRDPNTSEWKRVNPLGLEPSDIASLRGGAIQIGTEVAGAIAGVPGGPGGIVAGGVGGAAVGEYLRLLDGKNAGAHDLTENEMLTEALKSAGISLAAGVAGSALLKVTRFLKEGKLLDAVSEIEKVLGEGGADIVTAGRPTAVAAEEAIGVPRTVAGQARLGARETGTETAAGVIGGIERDIVGTAGGTPITQARIAGERAVTEAEERILAGQPAGREIQDVILAPAREAERRAVGVETRAASILDTITERGRDYQRLVGETIRDTFQTGRTAIGKRFDEEYKQIASQATERGVTFNLQNLGLRAKSLLAQANEDVFKSLSPDDITVLKDIIKSESLTDVEYSVFQRALSDLNTEIRMINAGTSPRRNVTQLIELRNEMQASKNIAFADEPELLSLLDETNDAFRQLKTDVDGGIIGTILRKDSSGNFELPSERAITETLGSSSKALQLREVLDNPDMAFLNNGAVQALRDGVHDLYVKRVIVDGAISPAKHATFVKNFGDSIDVLLGKDNITKFDEAADAVRMIRDLRVEQQNIVKQLNESLGVNVEKLTPRNLVSKIWNSNDPEKIENAMSILGDKPEVLDMFKGAIRNEIRRSASVDGVLQPSKLTEIIVERKENLRNVFGDAYVNELIDLKNAALMTRVGATVRSEITDKSQSVFQAATRVLFAPLTARGRAFTAAKLATSQSSQRAFAEVLTDPDRFVDLSRQLKNAKTTDAAVRILSNFGITGVNIPRIENGG